MGSEIKKGFIFSAQTSLWGGREVVGFGSSDWCIKEIGRDLANKVIVENHYSKKFYNATYIHLGLFIGGSLHGVLQFGYAMNPASCGCPKKSGPASRPARHFRWRC